MPYYDKKRKCWIYPRLKGEPTVNGKIEKPSIGMFVSLHDEDIFIRLNNSGAYYLEFGIEFMLEKIRNTNIKKDLPVHIQKWLDAYSLIEEKFKESEE